MATDALTLAATLIKSLEARRLMAYADSGGVPTIGYGHTRDVHLDMTCTQEDADTWLRQDLAVAADELETALFGSAPVLTQHETAALISFVFNCGAGPRKPQWHLWQALRDNQLALVPALIEQFDHVGSRVVKGLENRRLAEVSFWDTPDDA